MARVWDEFLTERDRAHLAASWTKTEPFGFGTRPVVLVIDDYLGSLGDKPLPLLEAVAEWTNSCGLEGWEAVAKTQTLLEVARRNEIKVLFTTNDPKGPPWALHTAGRPSVPAQYFDDRYEIVDQLKPLDNEPVLRKVAPSGFFGTSIMSYLTHWQIDTVLVCGNSTSGCVRATVVDASSYRFRTGVVEDCTFDRTQASHAMSLFDLDAKYADVVSLEETITYLERVGNTH